MANPSGRTSLRSPLTRTDFMQTNIVEPVEGSLVATRELIDRELRDANNVKCGTVNDLLFEDEKWVIRYLVALTGGFFSREKVLVSPFLLRNQHIAEPDEPLLTKLTKASVDSSPPLDAEAPVSRQYELELARHHEYPHYWHGKNLWGLISSPGLIENNPVEDALHEERMEEIRHQHIRSVNSLMSYNAFAGVDNEEVGEIVDFIVESGTWAIRHVVIRAGSWYEGKTIVLSTDWVSGISWENEQISFNSLSHAVIKAAPEYDYDARFSRPFEKELFDHYEKNYYWHV